ncbi:unnamed protein product [Schistosoma rodhaini]|uniref:Fcf2 domain-containing protein n=1 Tax=Schistosoma rodhaini TaxID=6188 RepID=A0AA85F9D2_9TREM|nr:unnamed protein product [Schistosoma rodhaini]CAH8493173.1 unnamed protein product [Schistosoma rodhaini]
MKVKLKKKSAENEKENEEMFVRLGDVPLDILRYNISMQSGVERKETRKSLLLKMGAKKPKNPYINYKELMQNKAKAKADAEAFAFDIMVGSGHIIFVKDDLTKLCGSSSFNYETHILDCKFIKY